MIWKLSYHLDFDLLDGRNRWLRFLLSRRYLLPLQRRERRLESGEWIVGESRERRGKEKI